MYLPKEQIANEQEVRDKVRGFQIMQVMGLNRAERRAIGKKNNGLKVPGSNKPFVHIKSK